MFLVDIARDSTRILRNRNIPFRKELFLNYLWLRVSEILLVRCLKIRLSKGQVLGSCINYFNFSMFLYLYQEIMVSCLYQFLSPVKDPLIIDCGSNIGVSIVFFKKLYPSATVIGFEPDPATFALLEENVKQNKLTDVTLHNKAITDTEGTVEFYVDPLNPGDLGMSTLKQSKLTKTFRVPCVTLSSIIGDMSVDFLKIDIEGSETRVLNELAESRAIGKIREMVVEYHHHLEGNVDALSELLKILETNEFGYQIKTYDWTFHTRGGFQPVWIHAYNKQLTS